MAYGQFVTRELNIVNDHYGLYGQSVIPGRSVLSSHSNSLQSTPSSQAVAHELTSYDQSVSKRQKFGYKSLVHTDSKVKRFLNKLDSDTFSLFSNKSHAQQYATVGTLPTEVLTMILSLLEDKSQISCLYVNRHFNKASKPLIYKAPHLRSTYRVAQFVSSLKEFPNGQLVKSLDLSKLEPGLSVAPDDSSALSDDVASALACWRDWKYKNDPLYGASFTYNLSKSKSTMSYDSAASTGSLNRFLTMFKGSDSELQKVKAALGKIFKWRIGMDRKASIKKLQKLSQDKQQTTVRFILDTVQPFNTSHPQTNKFLLKYADSKDLPIGYVLYLLDLCPNLQHVNMSNVSLSDDFEIIYEKPRINSLIDTVLDRRDESTRAHYLSDDNVHLDWKNPHTQLVRLRESDSLTRLSRLSSLTHLVLNNVTWLNYRVIHKFAQETMSIESLKYVEFNNSGMMRNLAWAKEFDNMGFRDYFAEDVEPVVDKPDEFDTIARGIGMNY